MTPESKNSDGSLYAANAFFFSIVIKAVVLFVCLYGAYQYLLMETRPYSKYLQITHTAVSSLLNNAGLEHEAKFSRHAYSGTFKTEEWAEVAVDKRSDGLLEIIILVSVVLAWSGSWLRKISYAVVGAGLLYGLYIARLTAAMLVDQYAPLRYDLMATWVFPLVPILFIVVYFLLFIREPAQPPASE